MRYKMNSFTNIVAMGTEKYSLKAKAKSIGTYIITFGKKYLT